MTKPQLIALFRSKMQKANLMSHYSAGYAALNNLNLFDNWQKATVTEVVQHMDHIIGEWQVEFNK